MKTQVSLSLDAERVSFLRNLSSRLKVPYSALADHFLMLGAKSTTPQLLLEWAEQERAKGASVVRSPAVKLRGSEARVLEALTDDWLELRDVQSSARTGAKVTFRALQGLVALGLAEWKEGSAAYLRPDTGTPAKSHWRRSRPGG